MSWVIYDKYKLNQQVNTNLINMATDTIKMLLVTSSYTPTNGSSGDTFASTPQAYEVPTGTGYSSGGPTIAGQTCGILSGDTVTFTCSNVVIPQDAGTGFTTAYYAILYKWSGAFGTSPLICYASFGANKSNQGGSLTIQIDSNGVWTLT
jgi:hypothetical protein